MAMSFDDFSRNDAVDEVLVEADRRLNELEFEEREGKDDDDDVITIAPCR